MGIWGTIDDHPEAFNILGTHDALKNYGERVFRDAELGI